MCCMYQLACRQYAVMWCLLHQRSFLYRVLPGCVLYALFAVACVVACVHVIVYVCVAHHRIALVRQLHIILQCPLDCGADSMCMPTPMHCDAHHNAFNHCRTQCAHLQCTVWLTDRSMPMMCQLMTSCTGVSQCGAWLHLLASCNDVYDTSCVVLQVHIASTTWHWFMFSCSRSLRTLWFAVSSVHFGTPAQQHHLEPENRSS